MLKRKSNAAMIDKLHSFAMQQEGLNNLNIGNISKKWSKRELRRVKSQLYGQGLKLDKQGSGQIPISPLLRQADSEVN